MHFSNANWLYRLLGIDPAQIPRDAVSQLVFRNAPQSWWVFVLIGIVLALGAAILYLYFREIDTCPPLAKVFLAGLRLAVILLLVAIFLDPAVYYTEKRKLKPSIVLLRDASQSMALTTDRYLDDDSARIVAAATGRSVEAVRSERPTRATLVNEVLARDNYRLLRELSRSGNVRVVDFSNSVTEVPLHGAKQNKAQPPARGTSAASLAQPSESPSPAIDLPPLNATGQGTDLCRAIQEGLRERLVAAIVLFTDGQHTPKEPGQRELRHLAEEARARDIPLLIVGVGDPAKPRNLAVTEAFADRQVWPGDKFAVQATLRAQGISDESVDVSLFERRVGENGAAEGPETKVATKPVLIPNGGGKISVQFTPTAPAPGQYSYTVRAAVLPNESDEKDNQASVPGQVQVLGDQAHVLLVSGEPSWEYLLLLRLLMREKSIRLSSWLQTMDSDRDQEGTTDEKGSAVIRKLPRTPAELANYDVVMLLDPNPDEFDASWLQMLKDFVGRHSGGVLYLAGPKYSGRFFSSERTQLVRDLLPVRLGDVDRQDVEQLLESNGRQWKLDIVPANADQPIMKLDPDAARSLARWAQLPGIYWSFPCLEAKPGMKVLIDRGDISATQRPGSRPLLVTGMYGSGRTVYVGFNGTWRWRRAPGSAGYYQRFWLQTVRYLVEGLSVGGKRRSKIETDRNRYTIGDRIAVTGWLKTPALDPLKVPQAVATLTESDNAPQQIELAQVANEPGKYAATLVARKQGSCSLSLKVPSETATMPQESKITFEIVLPDVESDRSWLDKPLLRDLAEVTKAKGGRYFELNELGRLPAQVPDRQQVTSVDSDAMPVRDSSRIPLVLLIVGLLSLEWALRKRYKLI